MAPPSAFDMVPLAEMYGPAMESRAVPDVWGATERSLRRACGAFTARTSAGLLLPLCIATREKAWEGISGSACNYRALYRLQVSYILSYLPPRQVVGPQEVFRGGMNFFQAVRVRPKL